jgi:DNA-binding transcriptional MocR family regulator
MATPLIAEIASRWIADGTAAELLRWQRQQLARRNDLAQRLLAGIGHAATPHGLHVWLPLPEPWSEAAFVAHARHYCVAVAAGSSFAIGDQPRPLGIRVCLGAGSEAELEEGLTVLARLAGSGPEPALLAV